MFNILLILNKLNAKKNYKIRQMVITLPVSVTFNLEFIAYLTLITLDHQNVLILSVKLRKQLTITKHYNFKLYMFIT